MTSGVRVLIAALAFLGLWAIGNGAAMAQIGAQGGEIAISSQELEVLNKERKAIFSGKVDAVQGDTRLRAGRMVAFYSNPPAGAADQSGSAALAGDIERIEADGEVVYITPRENARGDKATYDVVTDMITLSGNVIVNSSNNDVLRCSELRIQVGAAVSKCVGGGSRVQAVLAAKRNPQNPGQKPKTP